MNFVIKPSRNATLNLAYALLAAEDKRAKKQLPAEEVPQPKAAKKAAKKEKRK